MQSKIPGASKQLPIAYDTWGNSVKRDKGTGIAIFNQYLNPGSLSVGQSTELDKEINRIYEQLGDENVFSRKCYGIIAALNGANVEISASFGEKRHMIAHLGSHSF